MSGLLVAFEGGEGAGKSSRLAAARAALRDRGIPVTATRQPGGTPLGQLLREMLLDGRAPTPRAEALLYAADKAEHIDLVIQPALDRGHVVLCDRYIDSTIAYQGAGRGLDVGVLCRWSVGELRPHLTILLDVPADIGVERANRRGDANRFEAEERDFHERVNERFRALARRDRGRYLVLDATRDPADLDAAIVNAIVSLRETGKGPMSSITGLLGGAEIQPVQTWNVEANPFPGGVHLRVGGVGNTNVRPGQLVEEAARSYIARTLNVPIDSFGVHVYYPDDALIAAAMGAEGVDGHERPEPR